MMFFKTIDNGYISGIGTGNGGTGITESEYSTIMQKIQNKPTDPDGYAYRLRADNLEWELVELPPTPEYEPTIEDKAEAYDILIGEDGESE